MGGGVAALAMCVAVAGALLARRQWQRRASAATAASSSGGSGGKAALPHSGGSAPYAAAAAGDSLAVALSPPRKFERDEPVVLHSNPLARSRGSSQRNEFKPVAVPLR